MIQHCNMTSKGDSKCLSHARTLDQLELDTNEPAAQHVQRETSIMPLGNTQARKEF